MSDLHSVAVAGSAADGPALREIAAVLTERGVQVLASSGEAAFGADVFVVVVSDNLVRDQPALARLQALKSAKLVPVRVGPVDDRKLPEFLRALNWILWDSSDIDPGERNAALLTALRWDLNRYRDSQSLEAQAAAWEAADRESDYLLSDRRAITRALAELQAAQASRSAEPATPRLTAYLHQSGIAARREWWRRTRRWALRLVALAAVVAVVVTGWRAVTDLRSSNLLAAGLLVVDADEGRPDLQALKMAGLIVQQRARGREVPVAAYGKLIGAMESDWGRGVLGYAKDSHLNGFALTSDRDVAVSADSVGTVTTWDLTRGATVERVRVSTEPLYGVAATPDGKLAATFGADGVVRLTELPSRRTLMERRLAVTPERIAVGSDGQTVVVATDNGELWRLSAAAQGVSKDARIGSYDIVHDIQAGESGALWVVARAGRDLVVVDARTGEVRARYEWPASPLELAAVSPSGTTVVVADDDGALLRNEGRSKLSPLGMGVARGNNLLKVDDDGQVVVASSLAGARVVDTAAQRVTRVCSTLDSVTELAVSPDFRQLACGVAGVGEIADLDTVMSTGEPPGELVGRSGSSVEAAGTHLAVGAGGTVEIERNGMRTTIRPTDTAVTTSAHGVVPWTAGRVLGGGTPSLVAIAPDGKTIAVATDAGVVTEIDVGADGRLGLAARRDFGPRAVARLGWSPRMDRISAMTTDQRWLTTPSCAGCGSSMSALFASVRDRAWFCYPADTLKVFTEQTRREFDLSRCPAPEAVPN